MILLIRDPRAVFASFNSTGKKYPWLFHIRQWRKMATLTYMLSHDVRYKDRILVSKYEDLVDNPGSAGKKICDFLKIDYAADMIDGKKFRDGKGHAWTQNSTYGTSDKITRQFQQKWKEILTEKEIRLIEKLCFCEMKLFGYPPSLVASGEMVLEEVWEPLVVPENELADWIKPFANTELLQNISEMLKEYGRSKLLFADELKAQTVSPEILEGFFLRADYFSIARKESIVKAYHPT